MRLIYASQHQFTSCITLVCWLFSYCLSSKATGCILCVMRLRVGKRRSPCPPAPWGVLPIEGARRTPQTGQGAEGPWLAHLPVLRACAAGSRLFQPQLVLAFSSAFFPPAQNWCHCPPSKITAATNVSLRGEPSSAGALPWGAGFLQPPESAPPQGSELQLHGLPQKPSSSYSLLSLLFRNARDGSYCLCYPCVPFCPSVIKHLCDQIPTLNPPEITGAESVFLVASCLIQQTRQYSFVFFPTDECGGRGKPAALKSCYET